MAASLRQRKRQANGESSSTAPLVATAKCSVLHQDLVYEILVRLPAKPLCRLRSVCQSWRSLLSDSSFAAAHSARHGPLVAAFKREPVGVHIMDKFGHTVRHIRFEDYLRDRYPSVSCTNLDLFCFTGADGRPRVIDPATGVVSLLPDEPKFYHRSPFGFTGCVIGRASLTGEAKVLGVATNFSRVSSCKVLTLGGAGAGAGTGAGEWRETGCPPTSLLNSNKCVALVKGVLYFTGHDHHRGDDHIAAYNLETETWRPDLLHFPLPGERGRALAELSHSLVAVYDDHSSDQVRGVFLDLWFLTDSEKVLWSKRYTVTMPCQGFPTPSVCLATVGHPLWALDDGKIVFWVSHYQDTRVVHLLRVYDTRTNTCTSSVEMPGYDFVGVYKGSLLAGLLPCIRN